MPIETEIQEQEITVQGGGPSTSPAPDSSDASSDNNSSPKQQPQQEDEDPNTYNIESFKFIYDNFMVPNELSLFTEWMPYYSLAKPAQQIHDIFQSVYETGNGKIYVKVENETQYQNYKKFDEQYLKYLLLRIKSHPEYFEENNISRFLYDVMDKIWVNLNSTPENTVRVTMTNPLYYVGILFHDVYFLHINMPDPSLPVNRLIRLVRDDVNKTIEIRGMVSNPDLIYKIYQHLNIITGIIQNTIDGIIDISASCTDELNMLLKNYVDTLSK